MITEETVLEAIKLHLQKNQEHVCRIISSNYSQNWLTTESQIALAWSENKCLSADEYVHISAEGFDTEQGKSADITIVNKDKEILGKIEFELYDPNNPKKNEDSIKELKRRIDQHVTQRQMTGSRYPIIGILFAVWKVQLPNENTLNQEAAFFVELSSILKKYFSKPKFDSFTNFLPESIATNQTVDWGVTQWDASLLAVTIVSNAPEEVQGQQTLNWMDTIAEEENHSGISQENAAITAELEQAKKVQEKMLKEAPTIEGYHFATRYESCEGVSGDFYEFINLPDGRLGFSQGDVSGHGMTAGLVMSMAKKVLAMNARIGQSPSEVLASVNEELIHDLNGKTFVSMSYGILESANRKIRWARAGHNPSILYNIHTKELRSLKPPGMVVGLRDTFLFRNTLREEEITLYSGDIFLMYTDGLTETSNRQGEPYRQDRLEEVIKAWGHLEIDHLLDRIMDSTRSFRGSGNQTDDITLLAIKVN